MKTFLTAFLLIISICAFAQTAPPAAPEPGDTIPILFSALDKKLMPTIQKSISELEVKTAIAKAQYESTAAQLQSSQEKLNFLLMGRVNNTRVKNGKIDPTGELLDPDKAKFIKMGIDTLTIFVPKAEPDKPKDKKKK